MATRVVCTPNAVHRTGCPCQLVPTVQIASARPKDRVVVIHEFSTMRLRHVSKTGVIKNELPLGPIHHTLELDALRLNRSGASNVLLAKVSFDCLVTDIDGEEHREYLTFDLRIPGAKTDQEAVLSYDMLERLYGNKALLYAALAHFYQTGRAVANPRGQRHGHHPAYNPATSAHDQYIRHTEQLLVAYLALPESATMLRNRLRSHLRANYPAASRVKVYNMGLHMHSTKTCCAPCEYSLLGLMNTQNAVRLGRRRIGLLYHLQQALLQPDDQLSFSVPQASVFRLLVTVSANDQDADHKKALTYSRRVLQARDDVPSYDISVKDPRSAAHIALSKIFVGYDRRRLSAISGLEDRTIIISGSKATPGSPQAIARVRRERISDQEELGARLRTIQA